MKRCFAVIVATVALAAVLPSSAHAAWEPGDLVLAGVQLYGTSDASEPGTAGDVRCTPLPDGRTRIEFSGTYPQYQHPFEGPSSLSGSFITTLADGYGSVSGFEAQFALDPDSGTRIRGTIDGGAISIHAQCSRPAPYVVFNGYSLRYEATITTASRTYTTGGNASIYGQLGCSDPDPAAEHCDAERFREYVSLSLISTFGAPSNIWVVPADKRVLVGTQDSPEIQVNDDNGPKAGVTTYFERYREDGSTERVGTCVTATSGRCSIDYDGPSERATETLVGWVDADLDGRQGVGERQGYASRTWVTTFDEDSDAVYDDIDVDQGDGTGDSGRFATGYTTGRLVDAGGLTVTVRAAANATGVLVQAAGTGGPAKLTVCGGTELEVPAGGSVVFSCAKYGGIAVGDVTGGAVSLRAPGGATTATVSPGGAAILDATATGGMSLRNASGPVALSVDGSASRVVDAGGLAVVVEDAPAPKGFRITATGSGGPAVVSVCAGFELELPAGASVVVTCASVALSGVSGGPVTVRIPGVVAVTVPDGSEAKLDTRAGGGYSVTGVVGSVTVTAGSVTQVLTTGQTAGTWTFVGFERPVDNGGVLNTLKAGQGVPLKWRLLESDGTPVTTLTSVKITVEHYECGLGATQDALEEFATGASGLRNLGSGNYQFTWATPKAYAGSCKRLRLDAGEGVTHDALFKFSR